MKKTHLWNGFSEVPKSYEALCREHLPRPIHDKAELENATEIIDFLAGHRLNADQEDYLDLLSDLVEEYEEEHLPLKTSKLTGTKALAFLLEENDLNATDLSRLLGSDRTLGSKILRGERGLTVDHMRKLARRFAVEPGLFIG